MFPFLRLGRLLCIANGVKRPFYLRKLMFHDGKNIGWKISFQYFLIVFECRSFPSFTLRQNPVIAAASYNRFDIDPSSMKHSRSAAALRRRSAQLPNFAFKFRSKLSSLYGRFPEKYFEIRIFHGVGRGLESILAVTAGLNQIV